MSPIEHKRRLLVQLLALGALPLWHSRAAAALGDVPARLPPNRNFYRLRGRVTVNGMEARLDTRLSGGDRLETGPGAQAIFVFDRHAFLLRQNSRMEMRSSQPSRLESIVLAAGALLSVFGKAELDISTPAAVAGIRGTGAYAEAAPEKTYLCNCYGVIDIRSVAQPEESVRIVSRHHDAPKYILASPRDGQTILPAPFINHTDEELALIEALVGRTPPFFSPDDLYAPRRRRY